MVIASILLPNSLLTPGVRKGVRKGVRMRSDGYSSHSVGLFVCLSTTILAIQATKWLMSDTNSFSATRA